MYFAHMQAQEITIHYNYMYRNAAQRISFVGAPTDHRRRKYSTA